MAEYHLTVRAEEYLLEIYAHSARTFGLYQADAYAEGLNRTFGLIADFPSIGTSSNEIKAGYRVAAGGFIPLLPDYPSTYVKSLQVLDLSKESRGRPAPDVSRFLSLITMS